MAAYNMFKVLSPMMKDVYAEKRLKPPKIAKPAKIKGLKMPKAPNTNSGGY